MNDWIEFSGGKCPVDEDQFVEVKFRQGDTEFGYALNYDWYHMEYDPENDIVSYRLTDGKN